jgi:signal peptidase II
MKASQRIILVVITLMACVGCDQQTKSLAERHLRDAAPRSFLADTIRLDYAENPGAFLSLGELLPAKWRTAVFIAGAGVALSAILLYALVAEAGIAQVLGLALVAGGGAGNLIDRLTHGGLVRDFLNVGVGPLRTGIFNLADVALMGGCGLLLMQQMRRRGSR